MRTAAYWSEFVREAMQTGLARELLEHGIIELRAPVRIEIRGKVRTKKGWRERHAAAEYLPGNVLHREWREATEWETEEWSTLSQAELNSLGVFSQEGRFSIQIVEKIADLPAMIRQRSRHVLSRKIARAGMNFSLPGDAEILAQYSEKLADITRRLLDEREVSRELSGEIAQIMLRLESAKTHLKRSALSEIELISQGKFWEAPVRAARANAYLLEERARSYEIALQTIQLWERLVALTNTIERRFRNCYERLGKLGMRLQDHLRENPVPSAEQVRSIAQEARGIWIYLTENIPNFNPYYERLRAPEFHRLSRAAEHAAQGEPWTVYRDIEEAAAKLEAVALRRNSARTAR